MNTTHITDEPCYNPYCKKCLTELLPEAKALLKKYRRPKGKPARPRLWLRDKMKIGYVRAANLYSMAKGLPLTEPGI